MQQFKEEKMEQMIRQLAADYIQHESSGLSLITVTRVELSNRMTNARILISVLPEDKQDEALEFVRRKRQDFKEYVQENSRIGRIPHFDFAIDFGEKNRQRIDELSTT